jgi:hypothetical protein
MISRVHMAEFSKPSLVHRRTFNVAYENLTALESATIVATEFESQTYSRNGASGTDRRSYAVSSETIRRVLGFERRAGVKEAATEIRIALQKGGFPEVPPRSTNDRHALKVCQPDGKGA